MRNWEKKQCNVDNEPYVELEVQWPTHWLMDEFAAVTGSYCAPVKTMIRVQDPFIALSVGGFCHPGVALAHQQEINLEPKVVERQVR
jgi:hypothetical protein